VGLAAPPGAHSGVWWRFLLPQPGPRGANSTLSHGPQETVKSVVFWEPGPMERRASHWGRFGSPPASHLDRLHSILQAQQTRSQSSSALLSRDDKHEHLHHLDRTRWPGHGQPARPARYTLANAPVVSREAWELVAWDVASCLLFHTLSLLHVE